MKLESLVDFLRGNDVQVSVADGELVIRAPRGVLCTDVVAALREWKGELLTAINSGQLRLPAKSETQERSERIAPAMLPLIDLTQEEIDRIVAVVPGGTANVQDIYPLSPLQEGMLFHHMLQRTVDVYQAYWLLEFGSRTQLDAFTAALQSVIDRHDILRSCVHWERLSRPVQVVQRRAELAITALTLSGRADAAQELRELTQGAQRRFDLRYAPLLAGYVGEDERSSRWLLSLLTHHIVCDHLTLELIIGEVRLILSGRGDELPEAQPFRNFVAQALQTPTTQHEEYFRRELGDIEEPTAPFGVLDVQGDGASVREAHLVLDADLSAAVRACARRSGVAPAVLFHVAWARVLACCTGRREVVFGTVLSGRMQGSPGVERVLGMFMNTLPVRLSTSGSVRQVIADTQGRLAELLKHEQAPLAMAQRCSGVDAVMPLFTTLLNYRHGHAALGEGEGAADVFDGMRVVLSQERTNYPLIMSIDDTDEGFVCSAQAVEGIDAGRINGYLHATLERLVAAVSREDGQPLERIDVLPVAERRQILQEFNATQTQYAGSGLIHELFEAQVAATPTAVAVVFEDEQLSYAELNARANQLAHYLIGRGVRVEDRVAICVERSVEMLVGMLGVLKSGAGYVPLDPSYPAQRLSYMVQDSAPVMLLTQSGLQQHLPVLEVPVLCLDVDWSVITCGQDNSNPRVESLRPQHLAYVIYTSGSTGTPKGVMVEHNNVTRLFVTTQPWFQFGPTDVWMQVHSFAFDFSVWEIWGALLYGGRLVLASQATVRSPDALYDLLTVQRVTVLNQTPSAFRQLLAAQSLSAARHQLRHVIFGGEALEVGSLRPWYARSDNTDTRLTNMYGITEITVHATYYPLTPADTTRRGSSPIGCRLPDLQIYILDEHLEPVPLGVSGEIYIGGAGVARGYLNQEELTAQRFVRDPFSQTPEARMYKTGDVGRWREDGHIEYLGRNDFQVKLRGFRIELGEIEAKLGSCAGVREAVVIAREESAEERRLVAYVVMKEGAPLSVSGLREELSGTLPEYMVPSAFVELAQLPLTANGKLDRQALPAPDERAVAKRQYEAPQGEVESVLAQIWQELLGLTQVGRHDHFFELGGHSLLAVQLSSRIRQRLEVEVPLREIFEQPTLSGLAQRVRQLQPSVPSAIVRADRGERVPLSWAQQRLWFLDQLDPGASVAYHLPVSLRLAGLLDRAALRATLDRLVYRHESLRTSFVSVEGEPVQVIGSPEGGFSLREVDLRGLPGREQAVRVAQLSAAEAVERFDLSSGPLIRGQLLQLAEQEHILLITQHHIISDGWSMGVMIQEVTALYEAYLQGREDPLPALPIQYADYALWQRRHLQAGELERQVQYWREQLRGAPGLLELPTDRARPAVQSYAGQSVEVVLPPSLTRQLRALSQRHDSTLFMTLLCGWAVVLGRLSGQSEVVIGTPVANRGRAQLEPLIGFFVNTLALRVDLSGEPRVAQLLSDVRARVLSAFERQDVPFEQVVEALQPVRSLSFSPLFQVMLALNNTPAQRELQLSGLSVSRQASEQGSTQFDLSLSLTEVEEALVGELTYASSLFDRDTVERMVGYLQRVLWGMEEEEQQRIGELQLLSEAQREQVLVTFNAVEPVSALEERLVQELFEAQVAATPTAVAVVFEDEQLSYAELNARANQLAHYLIGRGVRVEDRVAICVERSVEMLVGMLGVLKSGAGYVPLDPSYPAQRLSYMVQDSAPVMLLTQSGLRERWAAEQLPMLLLDDAADRQRLAQQSTANPQSRALGLQPHHLAYVIYTSGSTGTPKGVMVEHRNLRDQLQALNGYYRLASHERVLQFASIAFDVSIEEIFGTLTAGATLILRSAAWITMDEFIAACETRHISVLNLPTSFWEELIRDESRSIPRSVTRITIGSEPVSEAALHAWFERGGHRPALFNAFGMTETTINSTIQALSTAARSWRSIGGPLANTRVYVLDGQRRPVPVGVMGEIYVGGGCVGRGYVGREDLTATRFVSDPFEPSGQGRMYRSGDLGRWLPEGTIEYLGRSDQQVKLRGFRIELGEIEAQLRRYAQVKDAAVLVRDDEGDERRLVAYFSAREGAPDIDSLRAHLHTVLPSYMVPDAFVQLESLPLTPNGKLDRQALPVPGWMTRALRPYEAPRGVIETALAQVWQELLRVERVGRQDNFFELGGHSLLAVSLIERLRRRGLHTDVRSVFMSPVLAYLALTVVQDLAVITPPVAPPNWITAATEAITPAMLPLVDLTQEEIDRIVAEVSGGVANVQDIYPLSPLQEGMLFHHMLETVADAYQDFWLLEFGSRTQLDAFTAALQSVIDRHDILRSCVHWERLSRPVQVVQRRAELAITALTLSGRAGAAQELRELTQGAQRRFDLRYAPLLAGYVGEDERSSRWLFSLLTHHIVCDHLTLELIIGEVRLILSGRGDELPEAQPFRNFVAQALQTPTTQHEEYFRRELGDIEEPTAPFGVLDVQGDGASVSEAHLVLDADLSAAVRACARRSGVAPAVLFHVAWARVLACCTGRREVVFGTVLSGRMQGSPGVERVLGMFMNTLPVRLSTSGSVRQVIADTQGRLAELLKHEQAPLAMAQRCSGVDAVMPLFTTLLNYRHGHAALGEGEGAADVFDGMRVVLSQERTNYPLIMSIDDTDEGFVCSAQAVEGIDAGRINGYLHATLERLVAAVSREDGQPLERIDVLPVAERRQILQEFNATQTQYAGSGLIHELFEAQVAATPTAVAVVFEDEQLSYAELNARANQLAHYLIGRGVRVEDRVAICVERSVEMLVGMLGVLKSGAGYVPLDPSYPAQRLSYMVQDSAPVMLLTQSGLRERWAAEQLPMLLLDDAADRQRLAQQSTANPQSRALGLQPHHLAYVIYTSGSTGTPKGVMVEHAGVCNLAQTEQKLFNVDASSRVLQFSSPAFDGSVYEIFMALISGASVCIASRDDLRPGQPLLDTLRRNRVTHTLLPGSALSACDTDCELPLRALIVAGEACPRALAARWGAHYPFFNAYGPTEATVCASVYQFDESCGRTMLIGRPLANVQIYILDEHLEPVPLGVSGEIYIGGAGVARGYLNRAELTAQRFVRDPFSEVPEARMYKTGDVGRWREDGHIEYLGRNDFQVKLRGFRIELGEIEAKLGSCAGVHEAVVIAREESAEERRLVAYVVMKEGAPLSVSGLREELSGTLPEYMVPSAFVELAQLPLTANGKLDRQALPAPDERAVAKRQYEAPQGEVEGVLAQIWQELLGLTQVGRHDHFFELGGHSLLAVRLVNVIREHFLVEIPLRSLMQHAELKHQAEDILQLQFERFLGADLAGMNEELGALSTEELQALLAHEASVTEAP